MSPSHTTSSALGHHRFESSAMCSGSMGDASAERAPNMTTRPYSRLASFAFFVISWGVMTDAHARSPLRDRVRVPSGELLDDYESVHVSRVVSIARTKAKATISLETLHLFKGEDEPRLKMATRSESLYCFARNGRDRSAFKNSNDWGGVRRPDFEGLS